MVIGKNLKSEFAPPERLHQSLIFEQYKAVLSDKKFHLFYELTPDFVVVLNEYRQIICANQTLIKFLNKNSSEDILGKRPGELFDCRGAVKKTGGCGTSILCGECGAVKAVLNSNHSDAQIEECCIQTKDNSITYNFRVWTIRPWKDKDWVLLIMRDIADEKFRNALEQTFFHDLTNTASDMQGLISLINSPENYIKFSGLLARLSDELIDEINGQRDLRYAEEGTILIQQSEINAMGIIREFVDIYKNQKISRGIILNIAEDSENISFFSDQRLISRVIENMIKNAIEACSEGQVVEIKCAKINDMIQFSVHNPNFIQKEVQLNIFKRSFSTKANGRGWGTYSMKLLSEKYLKGKVHFSSTRQNGTTFYAEYPLK
jgi:hypothetical protein